MTNKEIRIEKDALPLQMTYLPESFLIKAQLELNETQENIMTCLQELKKLIEGNLKCENANVEEFERVVFSVYQQCLRYPMTQISGFVVIHDYKNVTAGSVKLVTPRRLYNMMQAYVSCLPARYKEVHIVNEPIICKFIMQILKPLMPQKLRERIFIHSRQEDLLKHLPRHVLPEKCGGSIKQYYQGDFIKLACEEQAVSTLGGQPNFH